MSKILIRVAIGVACGVALYVFLSIGTDARRVAAALGQYRWSNFAIACALAAGNYLLRFARWELYLRRLEVRIPLGESLLVFLAGFSLTVTPGKLGEAVKALLLRQSRGIPAARTASTVVAERLTDLLALLALAMIGAAAFPIDRRILIAGGAVMLGGAAAVLAEPIARPLLRALGRVRRLRGFAGKLEELRSATASLLAPAPFAAGLALALAAWWLECVALQVVVAGFTGAAIDLQAATLIYALTTIAGALSFLPGGLGVTEAGMLALLAKVGTGLSAATAAAATFVTRAATLWFAVVLGLGALVLYARKTPIALALPGKAGNPARDSGA